MGVKFINHPIFLAPVFHEKIWGGTNLKDKFNYKTASDKVGECWAVSAHPNGRNFVNDGMHSGLTLDQLYKERKDLFGFYPTGKFPLLTKIIDAQDNLSVQVHPNDLNAMQEEPSEFGKTECWYVIDCEKDSEIILGHLARTKAELIELVKNEDWDNLFKRVKVSPGDFFYVPSGTVHAIGKGIIILETQQSSDITYRVFDYYRKDDKGNVRELHTDKFIEVANVPNVEETITPKMEKFTGAQITTFIQEKYFSVYKWDISSSYTSLQKHHFLIMSVIEGNGILQTEAGKYNLVKGDHFILPYNMGEFTLEGNMSLIVSHPSNRKKQKVEE